MRRHPLAWIAAIFICASALPANAQGPAHLKAHFRAIPLHSVESTSGAVSAAAIAAASSPSFPLWNYAQQSSRDGKTYKGTMVGRSPFFHGARTTNLDTILVPVKVTFEDTGTVFDPQQADPTCLPNGTVTALDLTQQSPIFTSTDFIMNGVLEPNTQYVDAFQRANFFDAVDLTGDSYHTVLNLKNTVGLSISIPAASGETFDTSSLLGCGPLGIVDVNALQKIAEKTLINAQGINPGNFPIFLFYNVVMNEGPPANPPDSNCCILGFHSGIGAASKVQLYSVADYDSTGVFDSTGDVSVLSHEIAELYDDPLVSNPTPAWGGTGQVETGCQNNLEVGDPLSGTLFPSVTMPNGVTYDLQELAFYSWFFGAPSIGAGGVFSDDGAFPFDAGAIC